MIDERWKKPIIIHPSSDHTGPNTFKSINGELSYIDIFY